MSHEVHVVAVEHLPRAESDLILGAGFSAVEVNDRHPCLAGAELYSAYVDSASAARILFADAVALCRELTDVGLLVERERVVRDVPLRAVRPRGGGDDAQVRERLERDTRHHRRYRRAKRADIHLSIPTSAIDDRTAERLAEFDVTFIRVARRGDELIFGRQPAPGEEWTAYTVQIDGPAAHAYAVELFDLLPAFLWSDGTPPLGTLKVEFAAEMFLTSRHPGIPAVSTAAERSL